MMQPIVEVESFAATSPLPHAIAIDGDRAYVSSRATRRIDVIDRASWMKIDELVPPGMPWGMNFGYGRLMMTCGEGDDDTRRIRVYAPEEGFDAGATPCPDDTGSHLGVLERGVLLGQWYNKKLLFLQRDGSVTRTLDAPHGIAGVTVIGEHAFLLGTDDEEHGEYWISRIDLRSGDARDVATVPFHARGLAWDGATFWTNFREGNRVVRFSIP